MPNTDDSFQNLARAKPQKQHIHIIELKSSRIRFGMGYPTCHLNVQVHINLLSIASIAVPLQIELKPL